MNTLVLLLALTQNAPPLPQVILPAQPERASSAPAPVAASMPDSTVSPQATPPPASEITQAPTPAATHDTPTPKAEPVKVAAYNTRQWKQLYIAGQWQWAWADVTPDPATGNYPYDPSSVRPVAGVVSAPAPAPAWQWATQMQACLPGQR